MGSLRGLPLNPPDDPSGTRAHSRRLSLTSPKNFRLDCAPPAPSADGRKRVRDCVPARGYGGGAEPPSRQRAEPPSRQRKSVVGIKDALQVEAVRRRGGTSGFAVLGL